MPEGFKRPGQNSRVSKAQPFSLGGGAKKGGIRGQATRKNTPIAPPSGDTTSSTGSKRAREDDEDETGNPKKARGETYTSPTDLSAFRAPVQQSVAISKDPALADFFEGVDEEEDLEFDDVEIEPVDDSPDVEPFFPGLCSTKLAAANLARYQAQQEKEREARAKEFESIAKVAATIPDLSVDASYNTCRNCPFIPGQINSQYGANRGENIFEDGTLTLEGDKQHLQWARLGSEYAVVSLRAMDLDRITWNGDGDFAALEVSKWFPAGLDEKAGTKDFTFLFHCENAIKVAESFGSALKKLRRAIKPDPIIVPKPTILEKPLPTPADSGYSGSPPPTAGLPSTTSHTPSEIAANNAQTLLYRDALARYGATGTWPNTTFSKANMRAFLEAKDKFHNIVDSTAWARGLGSKGKGVAQARIVSYLQRYPDEGLPVAGGQAAGVQGAVSTVLTAGGKNKGKKNEQQTEDTGRRFVAEWNGVHLGLYKTNEEAMEVTQTAMLADSQQAHEGGKERLIDDSGRRLLQG